MGVVIGFRVVSRRLSGFLFEVCHVGLCKNGVASQSQAVFPWILLIHVHLLSLVGQLLLCVELLYKVGQFAFARFAFFRSQSLQKVQGLPGGNLLAIHLGNHFVGVAGGYGFRSASFESSGWS